MTWLRRLLPMSAVRLKPAHIQKIDKSQIPDYANIDPDLLKMMETVDPGNEYGRPLFLGHQYAGD